MSEVVIHLYVNVLRPEDSEVTFRSPSQAATCLITQEYERQLIKNPDFHTFPTARQAPTL